MVRKKRVSKNKLPIGIIVIGVVLAAGLTGLIIYQYNAIKSWSNLIYPGVKIQGQDLSGKTKDEARKILEQKYASVVNNKKVNVSTPDSTYTLNYSDIGPKYNIDDVVNEAFAYGKNLNIFKRYKLVKGAVGNQYSLKLSYNTKAIDGFLSKVEKDVNKDPVDARLNVRGGNFTVVPDEKGAKLQKDKLQKEIVSKLDSNNGQVNVNIAAPVEVINAKITADKLDTINARIGTFNTNYGAISSPERANNIILATKSINGKVLMPGDTFSFNDVVGERTAEKGYESAPVIIGNQVDSGLGGGICQVSTTLYNAMLRANIKATERAHHTLPSHYVALGLDATVDYGNLDYKFENTLQYPIYIEGSTSGGIVSFNIYSNSSLTSTVSDINSEVYQTIQPGIKYIDDPTLPVGQTEQVQAPSTGYKVKVVKRTTQNGKLISEEVIADDFYQPVDAVIKRGTKK